jgi:hypothetical protein
MRVPEHLMRKITDEANRVHDEEVEEVTGAIRKEHHFLRKQF